MAHPRSRPSPARASSLAPALLKRGKCIHGNAKEIPATSCNKADGVLYTSSHLTTLLGCPEAFLQGSSCLACTQKSRDRCLQGNDAMNVRGLWLHGYTFQNNRQPTTNPMHREKTAGKLASSRFSNGAISNLSRLFQTRGETQKKIGSCSYKISASSMPLLDIHEPTISMGTAQENRT